LTNHAEAVRMKYIKPKKLPDRFPNVVEACGKPYDIGYKVGSEFKNIIKKFLSRWFNFFASLPLNHVSAARYAGIALSKEDALKVSAKMVPYAANFAPDLIEECQGIAEGSGVTFEEIFHLNCFLDIYDSVLLPQIRFKPWLGRIGCTDFAVAEKATKNRKDVIMGQTYDLDQPETFQEASTILRLSPEGSPSVLLYTIAGAVGCAGLNSFGIGIVINKLWSSDSGPGVPYCFLVRKALQKETVSEVLEAITTTKRASGNHFLVTNSSGDFFGLETTSTHHEIIIPSEGIYVHTNHYITEKLKPFDIAGPWTGTSYVRFSRMRRYLQENKGKITLEGCKEWMKDHTDYPFGICRHGSEKEPVESGARTVTAFILLPKELKMMATYGNPCVQLYKEYEISKP